MKSRWFSAWLLLVCGGASTTMFVACAGNEPASGPEDEGNVPVPVVDAAAFDADADSDGSDDVPSLPCTDDVLCSFGPFDPSFEGGPLDVRTRISAIRARNAADVWLVGVNGTVAHYDGTSWKRSDSGTIETLNDVWLRDEDEIVIARLSSFYRRNFDVADAGIDAGAPSADGWVALGQPPGPTQLTQSTKRVSSAWTAPGAEWAYVTSIEDPTPSTTAQRAINGIWRLRVGPTTNGLELANALPTGACTTLGCRQMTSVHGSSADDLWAVGYSGNIMQITGAQSAEPAFKPFDSQTWAELNGVWTASKTEAWAVGGGGIIRRYTGHPFAWDIVTDVPTTETLRAVWGSSATDVWAVGDAATVLHYDGTSWSRVEIAGLGRRRPDLFAVWTPAPGRVWIGGDGVFLSLGGKP